MQSRSSHEKALSCVRALRTTSQLPSRAVVAVREPHLWLWRKAVPFNVMLRQTSSFQLHSADRLKVPRQKKKEVFSPSSFSITLVAWWPHSSLSASHEEPSPPFSPCQLCPSHSLFAFSAQSAAKSCLGGRQLLILVFYKMWKSCGRTCVTCAVYLPTVFQGWGIPNYKEMSYSQTAIKTQIIKGRFD